MAHVGRDRAHVGFSRAHVAWGGGVRDLLEVWEWIGLCGVSGPGYPTIDSQSIIADSGQIGKTYVSGYSYRSRRWRSIMRRPTAARKIQAGVVTASLALNANAKSITLESFNNLKVYLCPDGSDPLANGSYDPALAALLATVAEGSLAVGVNTIPLNVSVLNANAGKDLTLLLTTSVEEAGAGLNPAGTGKNSIMSFYNLASILTLT